jgi:hypothetical protein
LPGPYSPFVRSFFERGGERLAKIRQKTTAGVEEIEKIINKEHVATLIRKEQGRGRSGSPKKRRPEPDTAPEEPISMKRRCLKQPTLLTSSFSTGSPELSFGGSTASESAEPCINNLTTSATIENDEDRLSRIKRLALKAQRPSDPVPHML